MWTVLNVPVSQLEHLYQVLKIIFESDVLVVFRENACSLEELFRFRYVSNPG